MPGKVKKPKPAGQYRNLRLKSGTWWFEVNTKTLGWVKLGGLSGDTSKADAEKFAQNTAEGWKKK